MSVIMRLSKMYVPFYRSFNGGIAPKSRSSWPIIAAIAMTAGLAACNTDSPKNLGQIGAVEGFFGGVVADEPRAVRVARDVLSAGGDAADAAVALYATMSVTKPSVSGLGGGGVCVVHDQKSKKVEVLDFWPRPGTRTSASQTAVSIPAVPRALYALSARYGRLQWGELLSAAEQYARLGVPVTRSLVRDINENREKIVGDPTLQKVLMPGGKALAVGDRLQPVNLASVLASLRVKGPGDFYNGNLGREIAQAAQQANVTLTVNDLRDYKPQWKLATKVAVGNQDLYLAYPPRSNAGDGKLAGQTDLEKILDRYLADITRNQDAGQADLSKSGFVVLDRDANAVACMTTMGQPFGAAKSIAAFGLNLASAGKADLQTPLMGPALMVNRYISDFYYGIAGTGTPAAATKQIAKMATDLIGPESAANIGMNNQGNSSVNVIDCKKGTPSYPESCQFTADPVGLGMVGQQ